MNDKKAACGRPSLLLFLQLCQHTGEFLRQGAGQLHDLAGAGMDEAQSGGVEALARQAGDGLFIAVDGVAEDRVPDVREVRAYLMRASRDQLDLQK